VAQGRIDEIPENHPCSLCFSAEKERRRFIKKPLRKRWITFDSSDNRLFTNLASVPLRFLSAYRDAGFSIQRAKLIPANAIGGGRDYQFHPDGIRTLEI
jgi:hypothetical protein